MIDETDPTSSEEIDDALLFGGVLIGQTKSFVGKGLVLGRLGQGEQEAWSAGSLGSRRPDRRGEGQGEELTSLAKAPQL